MNHNDKDFLPRTLTLLRTRHDNRPAGTHCSVTKFLPQVKLSGRTHLSRPRDSTISNIFLNLREPAHHQQDHLQLNFKNLEGEEQKKDIFPSSIEKKVTPGGTLGLQQDQVKLSDFRQGHKVGEGSYSVVKLFHKDNKKYACKIFKKPISPQMVEIVKKEVQILRGLNHHNIVKLYYYFEDTHYIYLVMEYVDGRTLTGLLKKSLSEPQVKHIFRQLLLAVGYLHSKNISHRDLKLDNIMVDDASNRVVVIDFGFGSTSTKKLKMYCGTPSYMCPEIVNRAWYWGPKADVWSLGVVLYKMLTGSFPFKGVSELDVSGKICKCKYSTPQRCSKEAVQLLKDMLCKLEEKRMACSELLGSKWFS